MRVWIVSHHNAEPEGTASGRAFWALGEGLVADGHDVSAISWAERPPDAAMPAWCEWRALPRVSAIAVRARALWRPRSDVARLGLEPPPDAVAVADDPESFAAVERCARSAVTIHYLTSVDVKVRRPEPRDLQDLRAERRAWRKARVVTAYSQRVASGIGPRAVPVPIAIPMPAAPVPFVEEPVAALLADWRWPPNVRALAELRRAWPAVRARVTSARLLLAGPGLAPDPSASNGVEILGTVSRAADVLSRAAVLAFPCPDSSGPKVKVIEALAHGLPVVTTPAGMEGVFAPDNAGAVVAPLDGFAGALAGALADPEGRARLAGEGRKAVGASHAPLAAARARVEAFRAIPGLIPAS